MALALVAAATFSKLIPFISATLAAVYSTMDGSFFFPRNGYGVRYGESVSTSRKSSGISSTTATVFLLFLYVTGPAMESVSPSFTYCFPSSALPEKQWRSTLASSHHPSWLSLLPALSAVLLPAFPTYPVVSGLPGNQLFHSSEKAPSSFNMSITS